MKKMLLITAAFLIVFAATMAVAQAEPAPLCDPRNKNCQILPPPGPTMAALTGPLMDGPEPAPLCDPRNKNCQILPPPGPTMAALTGLLMDGPEPAPLCDPRNKNCQILPPPGPSMAAVVSLTRYTRTLA